SVIPVSSRTSSLSAGDPASCAAVVRACGPAGGVAWPGGPGVPVAWRGGGPGGGPAGGGGGCGVGPGEGGRGRGRPGVVAQAVAGGGGGGAEGGVGLGGGGGEATGCTCRPGCLVPLPRSLSAAGTKSARSLSTHGNSGEYRARIRSVATLSALSLMMLAELAA